VAYAFPTFRELRIWLVRMRPLALGLALLVLTSQVALASDNTGRTRVQYQVGIYNYYTRYVFESDFPTNIGGFNCRSRMSDGAAQWNAVGRELRFASYASANENWIDVKWDDLLWPFNDDLAFVANNPIFGDIGNSDLNVNASPDKSGGGTWSWYCGTGDPSSAYIDLWSVAAHEFGHTVELLHSGVGADTMYATIASGTISKRSLTTHDKDGIKAMYAAAS